MKKLLPLLALSILSTASACPLTPALQQAITQAEQKFRIPPTLLNALIRQESGYCPQVISSKGAIGLGQLMPGTATTLNVNPYDPLDNIKGAATYLSQQYRRFNDWSLALAAYNAGPQNVSRYSGIPPFKETQKYVTTILTQFNSGAAPTITTTGSRTSVPIQTKPKQVNTYFPSSTITPPTGKPGPIQAAVNEDSPRITIIQTAGDTQ